MKTVTREELFAQVGKPLETTHWHTVTQEQINQFADCTLDHQFIHVDPEKAKQTPFGTTIAHGFLSLSMLAHFAESYGLAVEGAVMGINYGLNKVRFLTPVKVNSKIRCHAKLVDVVEKSPGQIMMTTSVEVEIENEEKPALIAESIALQIVNG